jgi:hypothetical protein
MKKLDIYLQNMRFKKAKQWIRKGESVLDIGADDGIMFEKFRGYISRGTGIEPVLETPIIRDTYKMWPGYFPDAVPAGETFDAITMLAVLEHIPLDVQQQLGVNCAKFLNPGGRVIITVPSPQVDMILDVLGTLKLIDGMQLHEHYGFKPEHTLEVFNVPGLTLLHRSTFQFGLNNLFVFEKSAQVNANA